MKPINNVAPQYSKLSKMHPNVNSIKTFPVLHLFLSTPNHNVDVPPDRPTKNGHQILMKITMEISCYFKHTSPTATQTILQVLLILLDINHMLSTKLFELLIQILYNLVKHMIS